MANLNETLHELRQAYVAESSDDLGGLARLIAEIEARPSAPTLEHIQRRFLGLAGSGYTYGFPLVSTLGRRGEKLCGALLRSENLVSPSILIACRAVVGDLRAEFDRLQATYAHGPWVSRAPQSRPSSFLRWARHA